MDAALRHLGEATPPPPSSRITTSNSADRETVARQRGLPSDRLRQMLLGDLDWITLKCLEKDRQRRYDTVGALGRLELLDSLGSATETYYQNLPASEKSRGSEIRRARILLLRGDVLYQRNDLPNAIRRYQQGITLLEPLLEDDAKMEAKRWHSTRLSRSGDALFGHGKFDGALAMR